TSADRAGARRTRCGTTTDRTITRCAIARTGTSATSIATIATSTASGRCTAASRPSATAAVRAATAPAATATIARWVPAIATSRAGAAPRAAAYTPTIVSPGAVGRATGRIVARGTIASSTRATDMTAAASGTADTGRER